MVVVARTECNAVEVDASAIAWAHAEDSLEKSIPSASADLEVESAGEVAVSAACGVVAGHAGEAGHIRSHCDDDHASAEAGQRHKGREEADPDGYSDAAEAQSRRSFVDLAKDEVGGNSTDRAH